MYNSKLNFRFLFSLIFLSFCIYRVAAQGNKNNELKVVNNPIIANLGVCDPHVHIFNNKAYLFASHDREPNDKFYGMYDWWVWSSSDLVHWKMEFNLFPKDMWVGSTNNCWAVDGAQKNGKTYFYVSGNWETGVAVSDKGPAGPYKDALGKIITNKMSYDPTVFIDDDANKTPYLITNGFPYKIARLNEDMISLAEEPRELIHTSVAWKGDGGFIHKRNGIYYLNGHGTSYATATNIYGPYTFRGKFYHKWVDHPTIFQWNNQTFCAFGKGDVGRVFRKTNMTYVHYKANGEMVASKEVGESFIGVGQYDCSKKIEAEHYFAATNGVEKQELGEGFVVSNLTNNASLCFQRVLNMQANAAISLQVASASAGGVIEVRKDRADGKLLGKINIPNTGSLSKYENVTDTLKNNSGLNTLYLVYKGSVSSTANIDWLEIASTGAIVEPPKGEPIIMAIGLTPKTPSVSATKQIEAEDLVSYHVLRTLDANDNGQTKQISFMKNNSYASYLIDFGSKAKSLRFQARVTAVKAGSIEIRKDSISGQLLGTCEYNVTAGDQQWITKECKVDAPTGINHIFLVFKMADEVKYEHSAPTVGLNWIKFVE
jgi:arabinoxylan arabinofuranohydrolase